MSGKVEIRCPNGHWVAVKISPNTKILQILEEACVKQGFQPASDYDLMHGKKSLDVTLSVRFAGIPNLAKLELVKSSSTRAETNVLIALQVPSGERIQAEFNPGTTIWSILLQCENLQDGQYKGKLTVCAEDGQHPVCIYTREEIIGQFAMEQTTLRSLGLVKGKAMLRLVHRHLSQETLDGIQDKINSEKSRQEKINTKAAEKLAAAAEKMDMVKASESTNMSHGKSQDSTTSHDRSGTKIEAVEDRKNKTKELLFGGGATPDNGNNSSQCKDKEMESSDSATLPSSLRTNKSKEVAQPSTSQSTSTLHDVVSSKHFKTALLSASDECRLTPEQEALARSLAEAIRPEMLKPHRDPAELERQKQKRKDRQQNHPIPRQIMQNQFADFKFPEATKGQNLYSNELSSVEREEFQPCDRETVLYSLLQQQEAESEGAEPMETEELPEDFFQVTESDVKKLWGDMQRKMKEEEDQYMMTKSMRLAAKEARMSHYERVVIRVSFPEKVVVQGLFRIRETVHALYKFVKEFLEDKSQDFYLYTTPPKCILKDRSSTLIEADLAPMSVVHFGTEKPKDYYLSAAVISEVSSELDAYKVLVKYMPKKNPSTSKSSGVSSASTSQQTRQGTSSRTGALTSSGKVPKWFKLGRK